MRKVLAVKSKPSKWMTTFGGEMGAGGKDQKVGWINFVYPDLEAFNPKKNPRPLLRKRIGLSG